MVRSIAIDEQLFEPLHSYSGFIEKVIFPGGMLPSRPRFREVAENAGLVCIEQYDSASITRAQRATGYRASSCANGKSAC